MRDIIIQKAIEEIEAKNFGVTRQFLKIHQVACREGKPVIARVDMEKGDGSAIVYFPVVGQKFYLAVYLDTLPIIVVNGVATETYNSVYFRASSPTLSLAELAAFTTLTPTGGRNKGDEKKPLTNNGMVWQESTIFFEPNPEADEFEDKLKKLLDYLYTDKEGITKLVEQAGGYIQVAIDFHNGNTMLGGLTIDVDSIRRMAAVNLEINFDLYASGKFYQ